MVRDEEGHPQWQPTQTLSYRQQESMNLLHPTALKKQDREKTVGIVA